MLTCEPQDATEHLKVQHAIERAMAQVLWQRDKIPDFGIADHGHLELRLWGKRREALHKQAAVVAM
jgi:hypothetical protein